MSIQANYPIRHVLTGTTVDGYRFHWNMGNGRLIVCRAGEIIDLIDGFVCPEHGVEGELVGWVATEREATSWFNGGPLATLPPVVC